MLTVNDENGMVQVWDLADLREAAVEVNSGFAVGAVAAEVNSTIAVCESNRLSVMQVRDLIGDPLESASKA